MKSGETSRRFSGSRSRLSANAVVRPRRIPRKLSIRAKECARGRKRRWTSPSRTPEARAIMSSAARWFACVWTTPFGAPVVPEVYTIVATSPGLDGVRGAPRARPGDAFRGPAPGAPSQSSTRRRVPPGRLGGSVDQDDALQARHLRRGGERLPELLLVLDEQRAGFRVPDDVGEGLGRIARVHRDRDAAGREDREVRPDPLPPGLGEEPDRVAWLAAQRDQAERDLPNLLAKSPPRHVAPGLVGLDTLRGLRPRSGHPVPEETSQGLLGSWRGPSLV